MKMKYFLPHVRLGQRAIKPVLGGLALAVIGLASPLAQGQIVTSGLVANYTVDSLSGTSVSTWTNSAVGAGAFGSAVMEGDVSSAGILSNQTPNAGKAAVDLANSGTRSGFLTTVNATAGGTYGAYTGMTFFVVAKVTDTTFIGGLAGTWEGNEIIQYFGSDAVAGFLNNTSFTPTISNVVGNWAIYALTMTNNTSGTNTQMNIYRTNYTVGTPTTDTANVTAASGSGLFTLNGQTTSDFFAIGTGIYQAGSPNVPSKSNVSGVLVYDHVLSAGDMTATTSALYSQYFSAVPEPGTVVLSGLGGVMLLFGRRLRGRWRKRDV